LKRTFTKLIAEKNKIIDNLSIKIGLFIDLNTKLHILEFFHLFIRKFLKKESIV